MSTEFSLNIMPQNRENEIVKQRPLNGFLPLLSLFSSLDEVTDFLLYKLWKRCFNRGIASGPDINKRKED